VGEPVVHLSADAVALCHGCGQIPLLVGLRAGGEELFCLEGSLLVLAAAVPRDGRCDCRERGLGDESDGILRARRRNGERSSHEADGPHG